MYEHRPRKTFSMDNTLRRLSRTDSQILRFSFIANPELYVSKEPARIASARNLSSAGHSSNTPKSLTEFLCSEGCEVFRLCGAVPIKVSATSLYRQRSKSDDDVDKLLSSGERSDWTHRPLRRTRSFDYIYIPNLPYMPEVSKRGAL